MLELKWRKVSQRRVYVNLKNIICDDINTHKAPEHCLLRSSSNDTSVMISTPHAQIMASKYQSPPNGREIADSKTGAKAVQDEF